VQRSQRFVPLVGVLLALLPAPLAAQTVGGSVTSFGVGEWLGLMLRLGLVVGVIWAAVYAMRWYTRRAAGERGSITRALDIVETRSLGPNRALHLVRIGGRAVLIGVTPDRINALMQIDDPEILDSLELTSDGLGRPAFGALLAGFGAGTSKSAQATTAAAPRASSLAGVASVLRPKVKAKKPDTRSVAPEAKSASVRRPRRSMVDRFMGVLGFTPVETVPEAIARLRAEAAALALVPEASMPPAAPTPLVPADAPMHASLFDRMGASRDDAGLAAVVAPSATQALRALSGYAAAQQSSMPARPGPAASVGWTARDERIAEAQRAIAAAQQKAG
jgi:flagellar biosynthetic protein FliO